MATETLSCGIEVLWEPPPPAEISIDIVAVPGLGAHPKRCWTSDWNETSSEFNWLSDENGLRWAVGGNVRILLFSEVSIRNGPTMDSLGDRLLNALQDARSGPNGAHNRPVVFIGHSTGGLIVANAIVRARVDRVPFPGLLEAICGAVFLGTPFQGFPASKLVVGLDAETRETVRRVESPLLGLMFPNIGHCALSALVGKFFAAAEQGNAKMELFGFYEELETDFSQLVPRAMGDSWARSVAADSNCRMIPGRGGDYLSARAGYSSISILRDHSNLIKFANCHDPVLEVILTPIRRVIETALEKGRQRFGAAKIVDEDSAGAVLHALQGVAVEEHYQKMNEKVGLPSGAPWIWNSEDFTHWLDVGQDTQPMRILGISGMGGRGKGAAAIAAIDKIRQSHTPFLLAYFFCGSMPHGRLRVESLLKSLLHQLIAQQRPLYRYATQFTDRYHLAKPPTESTKLHSPFPEAACTFENLSLALRRILEDETVGPVYFVIHGIDRLHGGGKATERLMRHLGELAAENNSEPRGGEKRMCTAKVRWLLITTTQNKYVAPKKGAKTQATRWVDLNNCKFDPVVMTRLRAYASQKVSALASEKGYDKAFSYFVSSLMAKEANALNSGTDWIDIVNVYLREILDLEKTPHVRHRLKKMVQNMAEPFVAKWNRLLDSTDVQFVEDAKEMFRALVICKRSPKPKELAVLAGLSTSPERVWCLLARCKELLIQREDDGAVVFVPGKNVELPMKNRAADLLELHDDGQKRQHGVLAWRCFADLKDTPCQYSIEHWVDHASDATEDFAEAISCEDDFWGKHSGIRERWLNEYEHFFSLTSGVAYPGSYITAKGSTGLHTATAVGHASLVAALIERSRGAFDSVEVECEVNTRNGNHHTPLHLAAYQGRIDLMRLLIKSKANVNDGMEDGFMTPLAMAAISGHEESVEWLLKHGASVDAVSSDQGPAIHCAIRSGNIEAVKTLITSNQAHAWMDGKWNPAGDQSLHLQPLVLAARFSDPQTIRLLLGYSLDHMQMGEYLAVFSQASKAGRGDVMNLLLQTPITQNARSPELGKCTPVFQEGLDSVVRVEKWGCLDVFLKRELVWKGVKWDDAIVAIAGSAAEPSDALERIGKAVGTDIRQETLAEALQAATLGGKTRTVQVLLETFKVAPDARTEPWKPTALAIAAQNGATELVCLLLKHGADVDAPFSWPLQAAAAEGHLEILGHLIAKGAKLSRQVDDRRFPWNTALQAASERGHHDAAERLLRAGADPNGGGRENGFCYIAAAAYLGHKEVVRVLLMYDAKTKVVDAEFGGSPLIGGAGVLPLDLMRQLLAGGADVNAADILYGDTALIRSALARRPDTVKELLEHGADVAHVNKRGVNALQAAREGGDAECLRLLVDRVSLLISDTKRPANPASAALVNQDVASADLSEADETTTDGGCQTPDFTDQSDSDATVSVSGSQRSFDIHEVAL
ncbi:ankyrin repeat-containing domain protein [Lasiosphaeris hirsuta]|uniref:Ankyrin repeat-containing domain protein n=1 Tax=Lasiosphaeris hirsuta TaxID=260670 RepID=A0AA40AG94_9PEZI|nr:ankyrin repeat-containing domain protein [Lasiosphaeris hirsuta]